MLNSRGGQLARAIKNVKADVVTKQLEAVAGRIFSEIRDTFEYGAINGILLTSGVFYENYIICDIGVFLVLTDGGTRNG